MSIETDKNLVRRAQTDSSRNGKALKQSITFQMAETRLAATNWFWSSDKQDFVHVAEPDADK